MTTNPESAAGNRTRRSVPLNSRISPLGVGRDELARALRRASVPSSLRSIIEEKPTTSAARNLGLVAMNSREP